jgi:hypothetical protein
MNMQYSMEQTTHCPSPPWQQQQQQATKTAAEMMAMGTMMQ